MRAVVFQNRFERSSAGCVQSSHLHGSLMVIWKNWNPYRLLLGQPSRSIVSACFDQLPQVKSGIVLVRGSRPGHSMQSSAARHAWLLTPAGFLSRCFTPAAAS